MNRFLRLDLCGEPPVAIRIDGKAFHTFTRGFEKPFDRALMKAMQLTMEYLCKHIQGCVFGYTQSDEITLNIFSLIGYGETKEEALEDYKKKFGYVMDELRAFERMLFETDVLENSMVEVDAGGNEIK